MKYSESILTCFRVTTVVTALLFIHGCSHPLEIAGNGDLVSQSGSRDCSLEDYQAALDNCSKNYVGGAYQETYEALPREGWLFDYWGNYCQATAVPECSFDVAAEDVQLFWGEVAPPLQATFSRHTLSGPILPDREITFGFRSILEQADYARKEFFLTGIARSYTPALPLPADGKVQATLSADSDDGSYKTRIVAIYPNDPAAFNGSVIVEWLNVTAGAGTPPDFIMAHNEFLRSGYAYVAVSAQAVGVNALATTPRYDTLYHPGDSYAYDIYTHAAQSILAGKLPVLGGLVPERIIATGESQSASRMVTYINVAHPVQQVFDGFMVHSRGSRGSSISQSPLPSYAYEGSVPIRNDLSVPVMVVMAEDDVLRSAGSVRQPDTALFRQWELAGSSHADAYTLEGGSDNGDGSTAITMFNLMRSPNNVFGCDKPINAGPHPWIMQAAFDALNTWVATNQSPDVALIAPAIGALYGVANVDPFTLERDADGNVIGGVRSPHMDAPVARLDGLNGGPSFCRLFGSTTPFTSQRILELYPTKADFIAQWTAVIEASIADGFMLESGGQELENAANAWDFPN